ncbi:MAG: PD40 domain-containing protein [Bacteroidetes bacterium]|nr:PD40 domain-containing protein [Bacteroidota bacterium]
MKIHLTYLQFFFYLPLAFAQTPGGGSGTVSEGKADEYFRAGNYPAALKQYYQLAKKDSTNIEYRHRLASCYLRCNTDKKKAVPHLEYIADKKKNNPDFLYELGLAYHYALKFDFAVKTYNQYKELTKKTDVDRLIEMCNNGKNFIRTPVNVTFENIGLGVNTEYPDYYPWVTIDENVLVFTSRRPSNIGGKDVDFDGLRPSDIYTASVIKGEFAKPQNLGALVNTSLDEQAVGISPDAGQIVIYIDWIEMFGDLLYTKKQGKSYVKTESMGENINTPELETAGTISPGGNVLYFSSKTIGGQGGSDIYLSRLLPDGSWGPRENLGPVINTQYNEDFPYLYPDEIHIYFSSDGHNSMGGYDLFKSTFDTIKKVWSKPENLGYPINTPDDNMNISFSATWEWNDDGTEKILSSQYAYVSTWRPDSKGDLDIYRIKFNNVEPRYTRVRGTLTAKIPAANKQFTSESVPEAEITVTNDVSGDIYGTYRARNGKYILALEPGKYSLSLEAPGYKSYEEKVTIFDKGSFVEEIVKDIAITK